MKANTEHGPGASPAAGDSAIGPLVEPDPFDHAVGVDRGVADQLVATMLAPGRGGRVWIAALVVVIGVGAVAYVRQLLYGLTVTAMTDYFSWGVYIINFVFFVGISMAGTLISAVLRLTAAPWRHPITRLAEGVTVFALLVAAPMVMIDMGRPDRFWHVLVYGRLQSPILWDVLSLNTYLAGSLLYVYVPLLPDLAALSRRPEFSPARRAIYRLASLGWRGSDAQFHRLNRAIAVLALGVIPVAVSIHTVTSWIFGMTLRPGWHSTIIGPDFVVGALYSGVAAVITAIAAFRKTLRLERFITPLHFRKLSLLLLALCLSYGYFVVNEYMGPAYTREGGERRLLWNLSHGPYAVEFYAMIAIALVVPFVLLVLPLSRTVGGVVAASVAVNVGMWLKRYVIVVPTLASPYVPAPPGRLAVYFPSWVEVAITAGAFAAFCLLFTLFAKAVPIVSMWEVSEDVAAEAGHAGRPHHDTPSVQAAAPVTGVVA